MPKSALRSLVLAALPFALLACAQTDPGDSAWNQFRGPDGSGIAAEARPPVEFGPTRNTRWVTTLPDGNSCPVIWGEKVFVTGIQDGAFETICLSRSTGDELWRTRAPEVPLERHHPENSPASSTAFVDEKHVYIYFGSFGMLCYDHEGTEVWRHAVSTPKNQHGTATSPIASDDYVYLIHDSIDGDSYVLALDKVSGKEAWKTARSVVNPNWSTPTMWRTDAGEQLVVLGGGRLIAYDPRSGEELWTLEGFGIPIPIPVVGDGRLVVSTLSGTQAGAEKSALRWSFYAPFDANADGKIVVDEIPESATVAMDPDNPDEAMPTRGIIQWVDSNRDRAMTEKEFQAFLDLTNMNVGSSVQALELESGSGEAAPNVAWKYERSVPHMTTSLHLDGRVYLVKRGGLVTCLDAATGRRVYFQRIGAGSYSASPVSANGNIYISSKEGIVTVFRAGDDPQVLAKNDLGERILATPAISGDTLFVRTQTKLYAFAEEELASRTTDEPSR